jgi:hypothetical protein
MDGDEEAGYMRGAIYPLLATVACDLPGHTQPEERQPREAAWQRNSMLRGSQGAEPAASQGAKGPVGPLAGAELLAALGGSHLTSYMGKVVPGWYQRPKVGKGGGSAGCGWGWGCGVGL